MRGWRDAGKCSVLLNWQSVRDPEIDHRRWNGKSMNHSQLFIITSNISKPLSILELWFFLYNLCITYSSTYNLCWNAECQTSKVSHWGLDPVVLAAPERKQAFLVQKIAFFSIFLRFFLFMDFHHLLSHLCFRQKPLHLQLYFLKQGFRHAWVSKALEEWEAECRSEAKRLAKAQRFGVFFGHIKWNLRWHNMRT